MPRIVGVVRHLLLRAFACLETHSFIATRAGLSLRVFCLFRLAYRNLQGNRSHFGEPNPKQKTTPSNWRLPGEWVHPSSRLSYLDIRMGGPAHGWPRVACWHPESPPQCLASPKEKSRSIATDRLGKRRYNQPRFPQKTVVSVPATCLNEGKSRPPLANLGDPFSSCWKAQNRTRPKGKMEKPLVTRMSAGRSRLILVACFWSHAQVVSCRTHRYGSWKWNLFDRFAQIT